LDRFPHLLRIGITGSSGKTTTKEIAAAMIGQEKQVVMNPGNLNSETGLPLAVFAVRDCHEVGIFEMGMNRKGEIEELARVLKPQIALITNIGTAHIGKIGSRLAILYEKRRIFSQFTGIETALLPRDNADGELLAQGIRGNIGFYGPDSLEELGAIAEKGLDGTDIIWGGISVSFGLPGRHNVKNALAAAAIAKAVPVGPDAIRAGLGAVKPLFGRGEIIRGALQGRRWYAKDGAPASPQPVTVIRDCYNANPESMEEALAFCDALEWPGRRVYVIGAMGELGPASPGAHKKLGAALAASRADRVFLYGPEAKSAAGQGRKVPFVYTDTMSDLSAELGAYIRPGDLVLLKGSRGCALERALEGIFLEYKARE
jgi:UDP-N-acetylmuramoyl-tripeptide--D-alanyl-D-alanine ligase